MPATARRLNITRSLGNDRNAEVSWLVHGAADYEEAITALEAEVEPTFDGLTLRNYGLGEAFGGGSWPGYARYAPAGFINANQPKAAEPMELGDPAIVTQSTRGGTQRILRSLETVASSRGVLWIGVPDFDQAINVVGDTIEGVEVGVAGSVFTYKTVLPAAFVTATYRELFESLYDHVNSSPFSGYPAGEIKFEGGTLSQRKGEDWDAEFIFGRSKNRTGITLNGSLADPLDKDGWDLLWVRYEDIEDTVAKTLTKSVRSAYVERVHPRADLNALLP